MFHGWDSYYLLVGSAAAALIGLMFIVITLSAEAHQAGSQVGRRLYISPAVFHFAVVLLISALALMPEVDALYAGSAITLGAVLALGYAIFNLYEFYQIETPHWSDIWFYGWLPIGLYLFLSADGAALVFAGKWAAYALAVLMMALMLMGIRNAWDLVTWIAAHGGDQVDTGLPVEKTQPEKTQPKKTKGTPAS